MKLKLQLRNCVHLMISISLTFTEIYGIKIKYTRVITNVFAVHFCHVYNSVAVGTCVKREWRHNRCQQQHVETNTVMFKNILWSLVSLVLTNNVRRCKYFSRYQTLCVHFGEYLYFYRREFWFSYLTDFFKMWIKTKLTVTVSHDIYS